MFSSFFSRFIFKSVNDYMSGIIFPVSEVSEFFNDLSIPLISIFVVERHILSLSLFIVYFVYALLFLRNDLSITLIGYDFLNLFLSVFNFLFLLHIDNFDSVFFSLSSSLF